jgi:branched-chain amino acid transport system ATP-binding protein
VTATTDRPAVLDVRNLGAGYGGVRAVIDVSLVVRPGEIVALIGANGAGKTSVLRAIAGLVQPEGGTVTFNGTDVTAVSTERKSRMGIALVPERRELFTGMSVRDNLTLGAYPLGGSREARARAQLTRDALEQRFPVLVTDRHKRAGHLSGGQQQQLAIARALMASPTLMLLDEPSFGLSPLLANSVFVALRELRDGGMAILLVEQNAELALRFCDRGLLMQTGRIVAEGTAAELRASSAVRAAYFGVRSTSVTDHGDRGVSSDTVPNERRC